MSENLLLQGLTFLAVWTGSVLGLGAYINKQFADMRRDFDAKHDENKARHDKLNNLVIKHETLLSRPHRGR